MANTIIVKERENDFTAFLKGRPHISGCGKTKTEAVGDLVRSHKEYFDIIINYSDKKVTERTDGESARTL